MRKRTIWIGLLLLATFLAEGCCYPRPFLFRRWWWGGCCEPACHGPALGSAYFGTPCCDAGAAPVMIDAHSAPGVIGVPPLAPANPGLNMPGATPLTRARFALVR